MVNKNNDWAYECINVHASIISSSTKAKAGNYFYEIGKMETCYWVIQIGFKSASLLHRRNVTVKKLLFDKVLGLGNV